MDEELTRAWRAAGAAPGDAAARRAYAQALLRVGHRAAALHELLAAGDPPPPLDDPETGWRLVLDPAGAWAPTQVAPPDRSDARVPGACLLEPGGARLPLPLAPWPPCPACQDQVEREACPACGGQGTEVELTGRAEEVRDCPACAGSGWERCPACAGSGLELVPLPPDPACPHLGLRREARLPAGDGELSRCEECGLAHVSQGPGRPPRAACPTCGRFACTCAENGRLR